MFLTSIFLKTMFLFAFSKAGNVHSPSTSMAGSGQYRQLINDYGPPSLGYSQAVQVNVSVWL